MSKAAGGSGTADWQQLETQIRGRLDRLVERARTVRSSVQRLLRRGRDFQELRDAATAMRERRNHGLESLVERETERAKTRHTAIVACRADVQRIRSLWELTVTARDAGWESYQRVFAGPMTVWREQLAQSRSESEREQAQVGEWLAIAERRWVATGGGRPVELQEESPAESSPKSAAAPEDEGKS